MSLFSKIFKINSKTHNSDVSKENAANPNLKKISDLETFLAKLLSTDSYIAKSDYLKTLDSSKDAVKYFEQLKTDDLLTDFCKKKQDFR